jgi:hypothetical protein
MRGLPSCNVVEQTAQDFKPNGGSDQPCKDPRQPVAAPLGYPVRLGGAIRWVDRGQPLCRFGQESGADNQGRAEAEDFHPDEGLDFVVGERCNQQGEQDLRGYPHDELVPCHSQRICFQHATGSGDSWHHSVPL